MLNIHLPGIQLHLGIEVRLTLGSLQLSGLQAANAHGDGPDDPDRIGESRHSSP